MIRIGRSTLVVCSIAALLMSLPAGFRELRHISRLAPAAALAQDQGGACAEYTAKMCEKAGPESTICQAVKLTTQLVSAKACEAILADLEVSYARLAAMKKSCDELESRLCTDLGEDSEACGEVRDYVPDLPPDQCDAMLGQYDLVVADLKRQQALHRSLNAADQKDVASGTDAVFGPSDAVVTVVTFSDFECPYCALTASVTNRIKDTYPSEVRFVFRHFPLEFHPNAHLAAQASLAAGAQGKFWEYHDLLFQNQKQLDRGSLEQHAKELGLDLKVFRAALDEGTFAQAVDGDVALGNRVVVTGTPTMFINGARVPNATDFPAVSAQVDAILKGSGR